MGRQKAVMNWSGGKDSMLALHHLLGKGTLDIKYLLTTINKVYNRISMHGVRKALLEKQIESLGIPLYEVILGESPGMDEYESTMNYHLNKIRAEGITHSVFGDIFLEDLKHYRQKKLEEIGLEAVFPLWKKDSYAIIKEFVALGYQTIVVCAREDLGHLCGKVIDADFADGLPEGVDPCGENGEFHTFVFDGPVFKQPVRFSTGEKIYKIFPSFSENDGPPPGYWYLDLVPYTES